VSDSAQIAAVSPHLAGLLGRFLQYVQIDTTADDGSQAVPSSPGQLDLGRLLVDQLRGWGVANADQDRTGVVRAGLASNVLPADEAATLVFNAHLDTSPEASGRNVQPQVVCYLGGDMVLANGLRISPQQTPELADLVGRTLVTTDGRTLLGGDDKAGVAIIMELANYLTSHPEFPRPNVLFLFTCDEEIGRGVHSLDVPALGGTVAYTFDGGGRGVINQATFSADLAVVDFCGVNIHPSIAKGRMVNALRAAGYFIGQLPRPWSPEESEGDAGFLHPYEISGGVAEVRLKVLLRDFAVANLQRQQELLRQAGEQTEREFPGLAVRIDVRSQYRNMEDGLAAEPRALRLAMQAFERVGVTPRLEKIRGGTDGSQLTSRGLPTPNLSSGQHNIHSPLEFACLEEMAEARDVGLELVRLWSQEPKVPRGAGDR
jgi:tripeptide aminopeptidase